MKRFQQILLGSLGVAVLAGWAAATAAGSCLTLIVASDSHGGINCQFTGEDADYCYYDCICIGTCSQIYDAMGLEDI
jgi:hypothetical protein